MSKQDNLSFFVNKLIIVIIAVRINFTAIIKVLFKKKNDLTLIEINVICQIPIYFKNGNLHFRLQTQVANTGCNYVKYYKC